MRYRINIKKVILVLFLFMTQLLFAEDRELMLEYYDGEGFSITDHLGDGFETTKYPGMPLFPQDVIINKNGHIELQYRDPSINNSIGSVILVRGESKIKYDKVDNDISLDMQKGQMRLEVDSSTSFRIVSVNTIANVSEGSYIFDYAEPENEKWHVFSGEIDVTDRETTESYNVPAQNTGSFEIGRGVLTKALSDTIQRELFKDFNFAWFTKLNKENQISGKEIEQLASTSVNPPPLRTAPIRSTNELTQWTSLSEDEKALRGGMLIDTDVSTVFDEIRFGLTLRPYFSTGRFSMEFYLPIQLGTDIIRDGVFNPNAFLFANGNNEWSFGSDHSWGLDPLAASADLVTDIISKIHYIQFASLRDPVFFYLGHLQNIAFGYGLLMDNFDNSPEHPKIRNPGMLFALDLSYFGFQLMAADVTEISEKPELFAMRIFTRPMVKRYRMEIGFAAAVDLNPARQLESTENWIYIAKSREIGYITASADISLPLINPRKPLSPLSLIAETSFLLPMVKIDGQKKFLLSKSMFTGSWPVTNALLVGLHGEVESKNWFNLAYQVDVRVQGALYNVASINSLYMTSGRIALAKNLSDFLTDRSSAIAIIEGRKTTLGIATKLDMIFLDIFAIDSEVWIPLDNSIGSYFFGQGDYFEIGLRIEPEDFFMNFVLSFQRRNFISYFLKPEPKNFLDSDTIIQGTLTFKLGSTILSVRGSTEIQSDNNGMYSLTSAGILPDGGGSLSFNVSFGM